MTLTDRRFLQRLARWRVPLGFAVGAVALVIATPTPTSVAAGAALATLGEALRLWASGHLEKNRGITTSGPYRWTAHPLYLGSAVMAAGLAVAANRLAVTVLVAAYLAVAVTAAARVEERALAERFGDMYRRYRAGRGEPSARRFSWARVRANRELRAVAGLLAVIAALALRACFPAR